jgi:hypothetical protein
MPTEDMKKLQESLRKRLNNGETLKEEEIAMLELTEEEIQLMEDFKRMAEGEAPRPGFKLSEFLATPSAQVLLPRVIIGAMREAAEPMYIGVKMLQKIRMTGPGQSMIFPSIGIMRAFDVPEGGEVPEDSIDWQTHETPEIRVGKSGIRIRVTEEMIADSQWDIVSMMIKQAGRALARHKEQKAFHQFRKHGHVVFDNYIRAQYPEAGTTGLDEHGNLNDTFSAEDFLDIIIAVMSNEYTPSDILMHPLAWTVFAKNELTGTMLAKPYDNYPAKGAPTNIKLGPESIQGRIPFNFNVQLSPFIPLDKRLRRFDVYVVDKNNIGVLLVKDELKTEEWTEPARGLKNVKMIERYGIGILNQGKAIAVAKNISMDRSYPQPMLIRNVGN